MPSATALNREVTYSDIRPEDWERELKREGLPQHLTRHLMTMAELALLLSLVVG